MKDIVKHFELHFEIVPANNENLIRECQALRYQIFCREQHIFDEYGTGDQLEIDEFDKRAIHSLLRYKKTGQYAATVRLILPNREKTSSNYPLFKHISGFSDEEKSIIKGIPRTHLSEISRFSVSKHFRRRLGEKNILHGVNKNFGKGFEENPHRRFDAYITLGLFKAIVKMSALNNVDYWLAFMEPSLIRLLRRVGIVFHRVGPVIDYCGIRHACHADAYEILQGIKEIRPEIWDFITEGGLYELLPCELT